MEQDQYTKEVGKVAASLSLIEIGLGSFLHSFKIPFSGQFLSLNQGLFLTRALKKTKVRSSGASISNVTALLKSLSPAGKKLTPMLAICAQGNLFALGPIFFGANLLGAIIGMILLSVWAFIQPLLVFMLIYGKDLIYMAEYYVRKMSRALSFDPSNILYIVLGVIAVKVLIGIVVAVVAYKVSDEKIEIYENYLSKFKKKSRAEGVSPLRGAIKDITSPLFLISFIFFGIFLYFSKSSASSMIWIWLRPLAVGFILFYIVRVFPVEKIPAKIQTKFPEFSKKLDSAIRQLKA